MKALLATILTLSIFCGSYAQEFELDTLLFNGAVENRINYVILGDGYLESQLPTFKNDAQNLVFKLFQVTPYEEYKDYFNVFSISVPSQESGAANDPNNLINNYFGSTFNYAGIGRLLVPTKNSKVTEVLVNHFPSYDQVFMLVNSSRYGGSGGWVATASTNEQSSEVAIHELGHSYANLADEYWAGEQYARETHNMTKETSPDRIRWKNWLGDEEVTIIPHTEDPDWQKPHENCKMQYLGVPFCAVCREQFVRTTQGLISTIDEYAPITLNNLSEKITFEVGLVVPNPNTLKIEWFLNEEKIDSILNSVDLEKTSLDAGNNELRVNVYDSTVFDRRMILYVHSVNWNIYNSITSSQSRTTMERQEEAEEEIITSLDEVIKDKLMLEVYPNPTTDRLKIDFTIQRPGMVQLSLLDVKGKLITAVSLGRGPGEHHYEFDMKGFEQGIYFLRFRSNTIEESIKILNGL